jgi:nucleotide-binding universal stress UspA family protein
MIRRILVPLDGSALAESILSYVQGVAGLTGASLTLLQVIEPPLEAVSRRAAEAAAPGTTAAAEAAARRYLAGVAARLARAGVEACAAAMVGPAAETIIQAGRAFDLIAMGTHGRSGVGRWVHGSVADKVLRGATAPVLLVRARADGPVADSHPRRILVPLDGADLAERALPLATLVARRAGAEVELVQSIFWAGMMIGDYPYGYGSLAGRDDLVEEARAAAADYLNQVRGLLASQGVAARTAVRLEPAADAILTAAAERSVDLIVMSTHGRGGLGRWALGSVAERVLQGASAPVLLVRAGVPVADAVVALPAVVAGP